LEALADHEAMPDDLWLCLRAVHGLAVSGQVDLASAVATAYVVAQIVGAPAAITSESHDLNPLNVATANAAAALLEIATTAPVRRYGVGEALLHEGAHDDTVFVVLSGKARVLRIGVGELAHLPAGAVIGEVAIITGSLRTATVVAENTVSALVLSSRSLAALCRALPPVYVRLRETGRARMVAQLMGAQSIFGGLDATARAALFEQCLPVSLPRGTTVITQGEPGRAMCIIASGFCEVWQRNVDGTEHQWARLGPGEVFGELALLFDRVASANVRTATVVTLFALDRQRFAETLDRFEGARTRITELAELRLGVRSGDGAPVLPTVSKAPAAAS
jgi:CRP-like cAMP-binding protein